MPNAQNRIFKPEYQISAMRIMQISQIGTLQEKNLLWDQKKKKSPFVTLSTADTSVFSDFRSKLNNWPHSLFILARKSLPAGEATMSMTGLTVPRLKNFAF